MNISSGGDNIAVSGHLPGDIDLLVNGSVALGNVLITAAAIGKRVVVAVSHISLPDAALLPPQIRSQPPQPDTPEHEEHP